MDYNSSKQSCVYSTKNKFDLGPAELLLNGFITALSVSINFLFLIMVAQKEFRKIPVNLHVLNLTVVNLVMNNAPVLDMLSYTFCNGKLLWLSSCLHLSFGTKYNLLFCCMAYHCCKKQICRDSWDTTQQRTRAKYLICISWVISGICFLVSVTAEAVNAPHDVYHVNNNETDNMYRMPVWSLPNSRFLVILIASLAVSTTIMNAMRIYFTLLRVKRQIVPRVTKFTSEFITSGNEVYHDHILQLGSLTLASSAEWNKNTCINSNIEFLKGNSAGPSFLRAPVLPSTLEEEDVELPVLNSIKRQVLMEKETSFTKPVSMAAPYHSINGRRKWFYPTYSTIDSETDFSDESKGVTDVPQNTQTEYFDTTQTHTQDSVKSAFNNHATVENVSSVSSSGFTNNLKLTEAVRIEQEDQGNTGTPSHTQTHSETPSVFINMRQQAKKSKSSSVSTLIDLCMSSKSSTDSAVVKIVQVGTSNTQAAEASSEEAPQNMHKVTLAWQASPGSGTSSRDEENKIIHDGGNPPKNPQDGCKRYQKEGKWSGASQSSVKLSSMTSRSSQSASVSQINKQQCTITINHESQINETNDTQLSDLKVLTSMSNLKFNMFVIMIFVLPYLIYLALFHVRALGLETHSDADLIHFVLSVLFNMTGLMSPLWYLFYHLNGSLCTKINSSTNDGVPTDISN